MSLTVPTTPSEETEALMHRIIGCALTVHRELGPGVLVGIYATALCL